MGSFWTEGVSYKIDCKVYLKAGTKGVYYREIGYSGYYRGLFHLDALESKRSDSVLYNHASEVLPSLEMKKEDFMMTVTGAHRRPVERLSQEGAAISRALAERESGKSVVLMNSKMEYGRNKLIRYNPTVDRIWQPTQDAQDQI